MAGGITPSQTIGPYFGVMLPLGSNRLVEPGSAFAIVIDGAVYDGAGAPVNDALVEIWQADLNGRYEHPDDPAHGATASPPGFGGWGRCATGPDGAFSFVTVKPGPVPGVDERLQAPHISVSVFARGLLRRLATRIYFPDETRLNVNDPLLSSIRDEAVRRTLVASEAGPGRYRFDIHLRGERETAFLAI
jgi:protocatechuate 3,4-dioxygenase alpha subunit